MVIFGAGASFDLDRQHRPLLVRKPRTGHEARGEVARPPLASQLFDPRFDSRVALYPACRPLIPKLRAAAPEIEPELERIRAEAIAGGGHQREHIERQLAGVRYYLREVVALTQSQWGDVYPHGITNYVELVNAIEAWRSRANESVSLVTFNYDTFLDEACRSVLAHFPLDTVDTYPSNDHYRLFKLHGSIDWFQEMRVLQGARPAEGNRLVLENALIDMPMVIEPTGRFTRVGQPLMGDWGPLGAAVSLPAVTKTGDSFACPYQHREILSHVLPYVTHLLVVGWRGQEGHFHQMWNDATGRSGGALTMRLIKSLVVDASGESARSVLDTLHDAMGIGGREMGVFGGGFSEFVESGRLAEFLS
jgi:hypothetical protein